MHFITNNRMKLKIHATINRSITVAVFVLFNDKVNSQEPKFTSFFLIEGKFCALLIFMFTFILHL